MTFNLLQYDVLVRGGLTAGCAYHASDFLYGTAVNRAYELESQSARNPLTLVSSEVVNDANKATALIISIGCLKMVRSDYFVDYLRWYADYQPTPIYAGKVVLDDPGNRVMEFIRQRLMHQTPAKVSRESGMVPGLLEPHCLSEWVLSAASKREPQNATFHAAQQS